MRVLLIESYQPLLRTLRQFLEEENFAVSTASDGDEADFLARQTAHDVIVLDLRLAKTDGLTLLRRWRRDGLKTHVLALTADADPQERACGLECGADDCLGKPFELTELVARLRDLNVLAIQGKDQGLRSRDRKRHGALLHIDD